MKKVIISVNGGNAEVELNDNNVVIGIIDYDNEEEYEYAIDGSEDVIIEVLGGVAHIKECADDVEVEIIDYDNLKNGF